jgi:hypothetical protein
MKEVLLLYLFLVLTGSYSIAQSPYARVNVGYALSAASQELGAEIESGGNVTQKYGSLGQGINLGLGIGYHLNENVAAELGFYYLIGRKYEFKTAYNNRSQTTTITGRSLFFVPALVLSTDFEAELAPFVRTGLIVGLPSIVTDAEEVEIVPMRTRTTETKERDYGGVSLGFSGALGIHYKIGDNLALFGEAQFNALSYRPSKWEIKESKENGQDVLDRINVTKGDYVDEYKEGKMKEQEREGFAAPFSSIGLNIGLKISF